MSTVAERLREEYKNERLIGISQGISQIIKNMLKAGMLESDIIYYTKIDKKLFNKIKKEIENETQNPVWYLYSRGDFTPLIFSKTFYHF